MSSRPSSSLRFTSGSISKEASPPSQLTRCAARSIEALPASMTARTSSSASTTGSRPILVQFEKKMSAKLGAITASKP